MKILTVSGSCRPKSSNIRLLEFLPQIMNEHIFTRFPIEGIPLFAPDFLQNPLPNQVIKWKDAVSKSDAVIICTPEYIFNIPAQIKNALEWFAASGELVQKPTLAITYTPHTPRGEKAMQSLIWCLQALDAKVVTSLALYHGGISFDSEGNLVNKEEIKMLQEAIGLLG